MASTIIRPDSSNAGWLVNPSGSSHWAVTDDVVEQPSVPDLTDYIYHDAGGGGFAQQSLRMSNPVGGPFSKVELWLYGYSASASNWFVLEDETNGVDVGLEGSLPSAAAWVSVVTVMTISQTLANNLQANINSSNSLDARVYAAYVKLTSQQSGLRMVV